MKPLKVAGLALLGLLMYTPIGNRLYYQAWWWRIPAPVVWVIDLAYIALYVMACNRIGRWRAARRRGF